MVLNDNKVKTGIPLEHIQGELEQVKGWSNGLALAGRGDHQPGERGVLGQQITNVESPFQVKGGVGGAGQPARASSSAAISGAGVRVTLDPTPSYGRR